MPVTGCVVLLSELSVTHLCGWIALFVHDLGSRLVQSAVGPTPTAGDSLSAVVPRSSPSVHRAPRHVAARDFAKNMSPASSGALELERYVGACLISSQQGRHKIKINNLNRQHHHHAGGYTTHHHHHRPHQQHNTSADQWAGMGGMPLISFNNPPQGWRRQENNPLARLAQGAPLILSNRYNHRKNNNNKPKQADSANKNKPPPEKDGGAVDTVSVTSDESSGSANSENCLPRIIKPRKRRKKDRKPPPHLLRPISQDGSFSTDSASPDLDSPFLTLMPYFSTSYLPYKSSPEVFADPCGDTPNLHHSFEDIQDFDVNGNQTESSCQCRYCDPTGQIWDIDRSCYSPYLTSPTQNAFQYPESASLLLSKSYSSSSMSSSSLAENMSSLSLDEPTRDIEVSTEIVTSLNGHRDLEIRFFSSKGESSATVDKDDAENCARSEKNVNGFVAEE